VKAALIGTTGATPRLDEVAAPQRSAGTTLLRVLAAPLNPIDQAVAAGVFYGGHPPHPYVPGNEVVGEVVESDRWPVGMTAWAGGGGLGTAHDGGLAEYALVADDQVEPVPDGLDPVTAGALGQAGLTGWLAARWRGQVSADDHVLVLGATGAVGLVALQAARIAGAETIVAVGRDPARLAATGDLGATAIVALGAVGDDEAAITALADRLRQAGDGPDLVIDPLWGVPGLAAIRAARPGARVVQLGQSAGASAPLTSATIRGKQLNLLGFSILAVPAEVRSAGYASLTRAALAGDVVIPTETFPLAETDQAWAAAHTARSKVVVTP
jgi:NADPH:quinone reductase-like Zn-dependent oxidoreductase